MAEVITDGQSARAEYNTNMTPDEKAFVQSVVNAKGDSPATRLHAVNLVISRRAQDSARNIQSAADDASEALSTPSRAERLAAHGLNMADVVTAGFVPKSIAAVDSAANAVDKAADLPPEKKIAAGGLMAALSPLLAPVAGPVLGAGVANKLIRGGTDVEGEAEQADPEAAFLGRMAGHLVNAPAEAQGIAGLLKGAGMLAGRAANAVGDSGVGARAAAAVRDALPSKALSALRTLAGDGGEVTPSMIESSTDIPEVPTESASTSPVPIATKVATPEAAPAPKGPVTKVDRTPAKGPTTKVDRTPRPSPAPPKVSRGALHDAVEAMSPKAPDMPADVMAAEVPKAQVMARPPKIGGSGEQLVAHVKNLPAEERIAFIKRIAADMGKGIAEKVAKAAHVSLKLDPL